MTLEDDRSNPAASVNRDSGSMTGGRAAPERLWLWPVTAFARFGALPLLLLVMIVYFQLRASVFLSVGNLQDDLWNASYLLLIASGQAVVLISGGFDLSVSSNVALTSVWTATLMSHLTHASTTSATLAGAGLAVGIGVGLGLINGIGVAIARVNPFIMTLATASIFQGVTLQISQGQEVSGLPMGFVNDLGSSYILGLPEALYIALPLVVILFALTKITRYGRYVYAVGSNPRAARISGVPSKRVLIAAYVVCATLTAVAGFLLTARVATGEPLLGGEYQLQSITAAVIGGVSLRGGEGGIGGTALGVAFVILLSNGMDLIRLGSDQELIVLGVVLALAVMVDRRRLAAREFLLRRRQERELKAGDSTIAAASPARQPTSTVEKGT